jgi:hypothetical protein
MYVAQVVAVEAMLAVHHTIQVVYQNSILLLVALEHCKVIAS